MLPAAHRLRRSEDFTVTVRRGRRRRQSTLVLHVLEPGAEDVGESPVRIGLIVSKSVGGSVVRHAVSRRLRAQLVPTVGQFRPGTTVVVRALPAIATANSHAIAADLSRAVRGLTGNQAAR